jgi:3-hydroxyacyl-CoA dehydrogenase
MVLHLHSAIISIMNLETHVDGNILLLRIANPPVNSLSWELRKQLHHAFSVTAADVRVDAVIVYGAGKYFSAGGDLRELGTAAASAPPRLSADVLLAIERCEKPVVAAIHGAAIGGGFELALACHYRMALDNARIALPEVQHGIIPLSGTLRLPRLWGVARALPMMLDSQPLTVADFNCSDVFDRIVAAAPDEEAAGKAQEPVAPLLPLAIDFARSIASARIDPAQVAGGSAVRAAGTLVRNRPFADANPGAELTATIARYGARPLTSAQSALIAAVRAGIEIPDFDAAMARCQKIYDVLTPFASKRT